MSDNEKLHDYFLKYNGVITPVQTAQTSGSDFDIDKQEVEESLEAMEQSILGVNFL
jgi:hypothetical protein